ncbi:MAG TPA: universal stress protein [Candidatus Methanomethylia archaeon]|nr:universal stress protein [Candidatus Methanomethylicia archaeon]
MYKTILAGVDGSEYSEAALDVAIDLAKKYGSKLIIATVYAAPAEMMGFIPPYPPKVPDEIKSKLEEMLAKYREKASKEGVTDVETKIIPAWEKAGAGLVTEAERSGCALLVIGTRGLTGLKRTLLGSVADYVVKHSHCDVLVVRRE